MFFGRLAPVVVAIVGAAYENGFETLAPLLRLDEARLSVAQAVLRRGCKLNSLPSRISTRLLSDVWRPAAITAAAAASAALPDDRVLCWENHVVRRSVILLTDDARELASDEASSSSSSIVALAAAATAAKMLR